MDSGSRETKDGIPIWDDSDTIQENETQGSCLPVPLIGLLLWCADIAMTLILRSTSFPGKHFIRSLGSVLLQCYVALLKSGVEAAPTVAHDWSVGPLVAWSSLPGMHFHGVWNRVRVLKIPYARQSECSDWVHLSVQLVWMRRDCEVLSVIVKGIESFSSHLLLSRYWHRRSLTSLFLSSPWSWRSSQ